jgi:uncharacterized protein (TIGR02266 family)
MVDSDFIREDSRIPVQLSVRVRLETWDQFSTLYTRDLSRGGVFLSMPDPAPPGTQLNLEVAAPDGRQIVLRGQVQHTISPETAAAEGKLAGVGVRFLEMDDDERDALGALMAEARSVAASGSTRLLARPSRSNDDLVAGLQAQLGEVKEQDYFEVLGVPHDAEQADIRRGYLMQVKRWHPTRYVEHPDQVRELVAEIFIIVQRANDALLDPVRRAVMRQRTAEREDKLEVEEMTADNEPAVRPSIPGLTAELVFAQRLTEEGKHTEARRLLSHALADEPDNWALRSQYNLASGRAALADGDPDAAALHFEEALRVNPRSTDAIHELRALMRGRRKARRAVVAKLFKGKTID